MSKVKTQSKQSHGESEFLKRVLGNLRTRDPAKIAEAERAIEVRLRKSQTTK